MNGILKEKIERADTILILGHIRPDGDCVGSTLGLYNYLQNTYPEKDAEVFLEAPSCKYSFLKGFDRIFTEPDPSKKFDLAVALDCSDRERLGGFADMFEAAKETFNMDHHITNPGFAGTTFCEPQSSSTCEVLYSFLDPDRVTKEIAACLYTGIINDSGVFKYSSTSDRTMEIAGKLMKTGIDFGGIIDRTFYQKTYLQNQILGRALLESILFMDGKCVFTSITKKEMDFYEVDGKDLDGIIDQLRLTEGIECAVFIYETGVSEWKVSMRSNYIVDVASIASYYNGGGHTHAAGCTMNGQVHDIINALAERIDEQIKIAENTKKNEQS